MAHHYTLQEVDRILKQISINLFAARKFLSETQRIMALKPKKRQEVLRLTSFKTIEELAKWVQRNQRKVHSNELLERKYRAIQKRLQGNKTIYLTDGEWTTYLFCEKYVELEHPDCGCEIEFRPLALKLRKAKGWNFATVKGYIGQLVKRGIIGTFTDSCYDYWLRNRDVDEEYGELLNVKIKRKPKGFTTNQL